LPASVADGVARVQNEVQKAVLKAPGIEQHAPWVDLAVEGEPDRGRQGRAGERRETVEEIAQDDGGGRISIGPDMRAILSSRSPPRRAAVCVAPISSLAPWGRGIFSSRALQAEDDGQEVGEVMGEAAGQLRGQLAFVRLRQRGARLRLFGDVGRQEVDAVDRLARVDLVGREGRADAAAGGRFGEFQNARLPRSARSSVGLQRVRPQGRAHPRSSGPRCRCRGRAEASPAAGW
jgi:hypothetical protein